MSVFGIGPLLVLVAAAVILAGIFIDRRWPGSFGFFPQTLFVRLFAILWSLIGLFFWAASAKMVLRGVPEERLMTGGVYGLCRNPMYAGFIIFLLPGLAFIFNKWYFLLAACVTGFVFSRLIVKEETALEERFGDKYRAYCARVPRLILKK
jgi:protein-S-isoprenylcysteine O-methyltransferase Ste14